MMKIILRAPRALLVSVFLLVAVIMSAPHAFANAKLLTKKVSSADISAYFKNRKPAEEIMNNAVVSGTITSISGTDITVTLLSPAKGQPATVVVHTASAKGARTANGASAPVRHTASNSSPKTRNENHPKGSKTTIRDVASVDAGLSVGDVVNAFGVKNSDGTITVKHLSAHAKKSPRQTQEVVKPKA